MIADPYAALQLPWGAPEAEVRQAFRRLALRHHPDRNPGDAEAEAHFKRISAAFQRLKSAGFYLPPPAPRQPHPGSSTPPRPSRAAEGQEDEGDWEPPPRPEFWPDGARIHYPTPREIDELRRRVEGASADSPFRSWSDRVAQGAVYLYFGVLVAAAAWGARGWLGLD